MFEYQIEMEKKSIIRNTITKSIDNIYIPKLSIDLMAIKNNIIKPTGITPKTPISKTLK